MTIEQALIAHLMAHPGLAALVATRIYPDKLPQNPTLPAVVYQNFGGPHDYTSTGEIAHDRIQVTAWSMSRAQSKAVIQQVMAAARRYSGLMGDVPVVGIWLEDQGGDYENDTGRYRSDVDLLIDYHVTDS